MSQKDIFTETHVNHHLFSDHYLNDILPKLDIWQETIEVMPAKETIRKLYLKVRNELSHSNEAQLERDFIQPILKILGHYVEIQAPLYGSQLFRPDYTFFRSEDEQKHAKKLQGKKEYFEHAIAIGDAKSWDRPLDRRIQKRKGIEDYSNPSVQINNYLIATSQKWGILTNGRLWRLYNKDTSFSLDRFYQVDLVKLIEQDDIEAFKYFYLLFRREAFESYDIQPSFLDFVYNESETYKVELEKDVKNRIYESLRILANGFLKFPKNNLDPMKDKQAIHDNCLILLYRMLFIFYAEARQLMPNHSEYKSHFSFDHLKRQIHEWKKKGENISPITTEYWGKLQALFILLNDPQGMYDMPQYNGGLFNPNNYPFLEKHQIGDHVMAEAFDLIACAKTKNNFGFVDYRTLDVQHLGSIYEGLLEYKLEFADQNKVIIKKGKKQEIIANKTDHPDLTIAYSKDEYYLVTDRGERKATGSYYTPDYIVRYIVENTLQPIVDKCDNYEQILELNVLDPAMGSGHFLVGVVDFLAEQILYHPTTPLLEEGEEEKEIAHWRRRVVERCVYGVDINPLAVELAKLSLWLHTVAYGKPLSFLDHHLRCGNSLIGARVKDLHDLPDIKKKKITPPKYAGEQISIFESRFLQQVKLAVGHYLLIERMETKTKEDIDKKEDLLKIAEEHLQQFKKIANVWVSAYFGNELNKDDYHVLLDALHENRFDEVQKLPFFQQAQKIAEEKRFFHWEMEFPDIFFDRYGRWQDNPGFDGVVGNPPYGVEFDKSDRIYYSNILSLSGKALNMAGCFIAKSFVLVTENQYVGMIVPKSLTFSKGWEPITKQIITNLILLVDASKAFEDVLLEQVVFICNKLNRLDSSYKTGQFKNEQISESATVEKDTFSKNGILLTGISMIELELAEKLCASKIRFLDVSETLRGLSWQKYLDKEGEEEIIAGKFIKRYGLKQNFDEYKVKLSGSNKSEKIKLLRSPKIISQNIVAHIQNPYPHIRIIATLDRKKRLSLDTVNNTISKSNRYSLEVLLALLNSKVLSWYMYRFVYNQAIRTMHFDAEYVGKLPVPHLDNSQSSKIIEFVNLALENRERENEKKFRSIDKEIDFLIYKLFALNQDEIKIIEKNTFHGGS